MTKLMKVAVLAIALFGLTAASASATGWHTNGSLAFTGTVTSRAPANNSILTITDRAGNRTVLGCQVTTGSGTLNASPAASVITWSTAASITPAFSNCRIAGTTAFTVTCASATLGTGAAPGAYVGPATAPGLGGVTTGSLTGIRCTLFVAGVSCSVVTGTVNGTYTNPNAPASGFLTVNAAGQSLSAASTCSAIPSGSANFSDPSGGNLVYTVTSPSSPAAQPWIYYGAP